MKHIVYNRYRITDLFCSINLFYEDEVHGIYMPTIIDDEINYFWFGDILL